MIRPWRPLNELTRLERGIGSLFNDMWRGFAPRMGSDQFGGFPIDVRDEGETFVVRAELPGVDKDKINLQVTEDTLCIATEKKEKKEVKEDSWIIQESSFGKMVRTVGLEAPVDATKAKASFENGVLTVTLPKSGPPKRGSNIQIS